MEKIDDDIERSDGLFAENIGEVVEGKKLLVLYSRLPDYFYSCLMDFTERFGWTVLVVRVKPETDAPYKFNSSDKIILEYESDYSTSRELVKRVLEFSPNGVYVSGWMVPKYRKVIKALKGNNLSVILGLDNHWNGGFKQVLFSVFFKLYWGKVYSHAFIPGLWQYEYVRKLGFKRERIAQGLYCANTNLFSLPRKQGNRQQRRMLFVGRLLPWKGVLDLIDAFSQALKHAEIDWELVIVGNGILYDEIKELKYSWLKIYSFLSQKELSTVAQNCDFFCLPSWNENWGVVVHEFALMGLPLLLSSRVGASVTFLIEGFNGLVFNAQDIKSLIEKLVLIFEMNDGELERLSCNSRELANRLTLEEWSYSLVSLLK